MNGYGFISPIIKLAKQNHSCRTKQYAGHSTVSSSYDSDRHTEESRV